MSQIVVDELEGSNKTDDVMKGHYILFFSTLSLMEVVINGILGIFPGGVIGQGEMGQKFYLLPWFSQQLGSWNGQAFWTDAGFLSEQEFAFITLHIFLMYLGFAYLRRGNNPENDLRIDPKNWSWMENYPYLHRFFVPIVIMWFVIIYSFSLWIFIILFCGTLIFLFVKNDPRDNILSIFNDLFPKNNSQFQVVVPMVQPQYQIPQTPQYPTKSESTQTISDSVAGGDVVGGDKFVNDPDTIAKVAIEAYRRGILESKED